MRSIKAIAHQLELLSRIKREATDAGWMLWDGPGRRQVVRFLRAGDIIDVGLEDMRVTTIIRHPKRGLSRLTRRDVDLGSLKRIFNDPRAHTWLGVERRGVGRHAPARGS